MRPVRTISRKGRESSKRTKVFLESFLGILRDHTPDVVTSPVTTKIWSDLHGDMQRAAEMTAPLKNHGRLSYPFSGVRGVPRILKP